MGDQLPPEIAKIINEHKYEDPTDWFCKKGFGKPIAVENAPDPKDKKAAAKALAQEKAKEREAQKNQLDKEYKIYQEKMEQ